MIWGVLGSGLVVDLLASSILTYYLKRSRTGWTRYALLSVFGTSFFSDGHARFQDRLDHRHHDGIRD